MNSISMSYPRLTGSVMVSCVILVVTVGQGFAEDWGSVLGSMKPERLEGWSGGLSVETAQAEARFDFDIPAEPLAVALTRFQQTTGLKVAADSQTIAAARTVGLRGSLTAQEALAALLAGTGLNHRMADAETVVIEQAAANAPTGGPVVLNPLPVTAEGDRQVPTGPIDGYVAERGTSGTKTDTPIMETPQSIAVVTRDQMDAQNVNDVGDVLRYTAGASSEPYGTDKRGLFFTLRGFNVSDEAFYRDGLQLRGSAFAGYTSLDPYGAERYELLKGPSSVLYGQISPGGLLNYVTKRPTEEAFGEVELEGGYPARAGGAFDVGGPVTPDGDVLFRLTGRGYSADTQVDYVDENRGYFAPALTWRPSDDTTLTLLANFQYDRFGWTNQFLPASGTVFRNPHGFIPTSRMLSEPDWDDYEQYQVAVGYLFEHKFNETFTFRQNARFAHMENEQRGIFGIGFQADDRTFDRMGDSGESTSNAVVVDTNVEIDVPTDIGVSHKALVGVDFLRNAMDDLGESWDVAPIDVFDPDYGAELTPLGAYLQDQVKIGDLTFVIGGRYDWAKINTKDHLADERRRQTDEAFTGRVGAIYNFAFGVAPYASYSTSFVPTVGSDADGNSFEPETGEQIEVGIKVQPPGTNVMVTVAGFEIYQQNTLTTDPNDPNFSVQNGEIRSRGVEFEARANLDMGLDVIAAYAFNDVEFTKDEDGNEGNTPSVTPRHRASLWVDYTLPEGPLADFGFGMGVRYTGEQFGDDANTFKVADYAVVDAAIHYDYEPFSFAINATNLFNKRYVASCFGADSGCFYGERLQVTGTVKYRW